MLDADQYAGYLALNGLADETIRNYRAMYVRWCDWAIAHDRDPYRPDPLAVRAFAAQLTGGRSLTAQARAMISHLCDATESEQVAAAVPLPAKPKPTHRALDHDVAVRFADTARRSGLKGTAVLVALYTAARRSEVASLAWSRISFDTCRVTLERPKNRDLHPVPLHPHLAAHLEERRVPGELWVFPGRNGGHVSPATIWQWTLEVAEAAGIGRVTPHQLRHTALTDAYDATKDVLAVRNFAGHSSVVTTQRYTRGSVVALEAAVGALDYGGSR